MRADILLRRGFGGQARVRPYKIFMLYFLETIEPLILVVHFIVCFFLIVVILLQAGKGADIGATFGAGSSQSLFGARGAATFLSKLTTAGAMIFLLTSVSLAGIHKGRSKTGGGESVVEKMPVEAPVAPAPEVVPTTAPAAPEATPPAKPAEEKK